MVDKFHLYNFQSGGKSAFLAFFLLLFIFCTYGQETSKQAQYDSVFVRKGRYMFLGDSIFFVPKDTVLFIPQNTTFQIDKDTYEKSVNFYDSLKVKAAKRNLTKKLYELLIVSSYQSKESAPIKQKSENPFVQYQGKRIRKIILYKTEVFGSTLFDTTRIASTWIEKNLNRIHINTNDRIIRKNLLINEGDTINPFTLADNERVLRELSFIDDARIRVIPVEPGIVDIHVITKDVFSFGFGVEFNDINEGTVEIFNRNIFGTGHDVQANLFFDYDTVPSWGYEGIYRIDNIEGTFINATVNYKNAFETENFGLDLSRRFVTPYTKYAGGIKLISTSTLTQQDTLPVLVPLKFNYQDYWIGRSFLLNPTSRSRLVISGRYVSKYIIKRPEIGENTKYKYRDYILYLGSIAFSRQNYYKTNLIYNFGRTEDIPYGTLIEFTGGYEDYELYNRIYTGLRISHGNYFQKIGFLHSSFNIAGYIRNKAYQQGMIRVKTNYFTNLFTIRNYQLRQFINLDYTIGIRRFEDELISISNKNGIRGLKSDSLSGVQRLTLNLETVAFSPIYVYGFRCTFFGYTDIGFIGSNKRNIFKNQLYSGIGLGVRIRNKNLVFKTFQIRFSYYPVLPPDYSKNWIYFSGEKLLNPQDFDVRLPTIHEFR